MIPVGQMDRLVTIQQLTETRDSAKKTVKLAWSTLGTAYMAMRPAGGRERFTREQLSAPQETVWHTHYREDLDPLVVDVPKTRRLRYEGRSLEITQAHHVGMREGIELVTLANSKVPS